MDDDLLLKETNNLLKLFFNFASKQRKSRLRIFYPVQKFFLYKTFENNFKNIKKICNIDIKINAEGNYISVALCDKNNNIKKAKVFFVTNGIKIWILGNKEEIMLFSINKKKAMPFEKASLFLFKSISDED